MATQIQILNVFCKITGFNPEDIWGTPNYKSLTFVTKFGGKYQMSKDGKKVRTLQGPDYPNLKPEV